MIQMGLTALSLICSVFVLRLVHTDYKDVPEVLRKVCSKHNNYRLFTVLGIHLISFVRISSASVI